MLLSLLRMIQAIRNINATLSGVSQVGDRERADIGSNRSGIPRVAAGNSNGRINPTTHGGRGGLIRATIGINQAGQGHVGLAKTRNKQS
jgi:hypothetical protein